MIRIAALLALLVLIASALEPDRIIITGDGIQPILAPRPSMDRYVTASGGGGGVMVGGGGGGGSTTNGTGGSGGGGGGSGIVSVCGGSDIVSVCNNGGGGRVLTSTMSVVGAPSYSTTYSTILPNGQ